LAAQTGAALPIRGADPNQARNAIWFRCPPLEKVRIGMIGVGTWFVIDERFA